MGGTELLPGGSMLDTQPRCRPALAGSLPAGGKGGYRDHGHVWISLVPLLTQDGGETALCTQSVAQNFPPGIHFGTSNAAPLPPLVSGLTHFFLKNVGNKEICNVLSNIPKIPLGFIFYILLS